MEQHISAAGMGARVAGQEGFRRDPFAEICSYSAEERIVRQELWHDGVGMSLYAKRLDKGRFIWPQTVDGVVALTQSRWDTSRGDRLATSATDLAAASGRKQAG